MSKAAGIATAFLIAACLVQACGEPEPQPEQEKPFFPPFEYFPEHQFYQVRFGQSSDEVEQQLYILGFEKIDSSGSSTFRHRTDSIEFILPDREHLTAFKVFLRSELYIHQQPGLHEYLGATASSKEQADDFTVFRYERDGSTFKLTLFAQDYVLRLSFEQEEVK